MKIFDKVHPTLFKVDFIRAGEDRVTLTLYESTFEEVLAFVSKQVNTYGSVIKKGRSTQVRVRETVAGKVIKGKDKSITFYGMGPRDMYDLIVELLLGE